MSKSVRVSDTSSASFCPNDPAIYTGEAHVGILPTDMAFQTRTRNGQEIQQFSVPVTLITQLV